VEPEDGIDDYNEAMWDKLGHPAFDKDYLAKLQEKFDDEHHANNQ